MELKGRVGLVTGGSSGIGAETVKALAKRGCKVVIGYNNGAKRAVNLLESLHGSGHNCLKINLGNQDLLQGAEKFVRNNYGKLDFLINSAGYTEPIKHSDLASLSPTKFNSIVNTNAGGTYAVIRTFVPLLSNTSGATVINVSSVSAFTGSGSNIAYCAAKAAIDTMTISLARALGPQIRVLCVSPASVATNFVKGRTEEHLRAIADHTPMKKIITAKEVSLGILACLTHLTSATGTKIVIDGGHHIR